MTRINTNVSSLIAQKDLARSNADLQSALTRLSTGLRINVGKDDPAGLIASEALRSDIISVEKAITNSERANQLIATADSALGQVSSLLNDIRGLVTEAANTGALSDEQIAANQLQVDSSLEAIDRIAQVTTFQGRKLLDGSLSFTTSGSTNFDRISDLNIDQANLGTSGTIAVDVTVSTAATQAQVAVAGVPAATSAVNAFDDVAFTNTATQASGNITLANSGFQFSVAAVAAGSADGAEGNGVDVVINDAVGATAAVYNGTDTLTISANITGGGIDIDALVAAVDAEGTFDATAISPGASVVVALDATTHTDPLTGGRDAGSSTIRVVADTAGVAANGVTLTTIEDGTIAANSAQAAIVSGNIEVRVNGTVTYADIASAVDGLTGYGASVTAAAGDQNYIDTSDTPPGVATLASGVDAGGGITQDVTFSLSGQNGSEVFTFQAGSSISQLEAAIDAVSDGTGITATVNGTTLELDSTAYGSDSFVDIAVISEAAGGTITAAVGAGSRAAGTDVVATINGISGTGKGNALSLNTSTLDMRLNVDAGFTGTSNFSVTGGGALFQLGPEVVGNQQARLGINSVNTATLGGVTGRLFELRSGGTKDLATDTTGAAKIIGEVVDKVTNLRGRLGAFQKTTLETNIFTLNDQLANLTEAESAIRDADFAAESAKLTRAQILVQSGTSVLSIANSNPQNVLALLR